MKYIKTLKIDIDKKNFEVIPSVQYDSNTRFLHIQLLNDSVPFDITGCSVILSGIKEDGNQIFNSCDIINSEIGFIQAEVTEQMNAIPGYIDCEIKIYDGEGVLTSKKFTIKVTASQTSRAVESTGEFKALTEALSKVNNINNKMDRGESISASQIDKNKGKFDQTYFTDEFLQQMAGNTPVNSTPSDGGVTTEKLANESVTFEKVSDKSALTSLNPYNLFNNSLLKQEVGGWQLNKNASFYDEVIKFDGFNTIRVVKDEGNVQNNHFYQSKKDLKDKTQYVVLAEVYCEKASRVRIQWYRYKDNVYVDSLPSEHYLNVGRNIISATFTTDYTIANEYRIAFGLNNYGTVWFGKPVLIESTIENKYFSNYDGTTHIESKLNKVINEVQFNPNNLNLEHGNPVGWNIKADKTEYSEIEIDGFKTLRVWSDDGATAIPYKGIKFDEPFSGKLTTSMKVKVVLREGMSYPVTIYATSLGYQPGATTGATTVQKGYVIKKDGIYEIAVTQDYNNWGKIHACFELKTNVVECYINQLTVVHGENPQPHTITSMFNVMGKHEEEIKELYNLIDETEKNYSINPLWGKIIALNGDSICAGTVNGGGYGVIIANKNNMTYQNVAVGGGTITAETYQLPENYPDLTKPKARHWISRTVSKMRDDADYIILEGGINDFWNKVPLGEITPNYNSLLDDTTFCGAFESMLKQAILKWPGKKIGFIIVHKITNTYYPYGNSTPGKFELYREKIIEICNKWSIPYLDLFNCSGLNVNIQEIKQKYTTKGDGTHPNAEGYELFYVPKIEAWMKTL